jgi:hypothetical protein
MEKKDPPFNLAVTLVLFLFLVVKDSPSMLNLKAIDFSNCS